ncbi:hypothetical protein C9I87_06565 [Photobacterium iliopiscarium]|nr:hypothetical protein C9I87_06565 [Photobacterium iliopiscarium]
MVLFVLYLVNEYFMPNANIIPINSNVVSQLVDEISLNDKLSRLKRLDLSNATVNIWITEVNIRNLSKRFIKLKRLNIHSDDHDTFKDFVVDCIDGSEHIEQLRPVTTIQDNRLYYVESAATDLTQIHNLITNTTETELNDQNELNSYNAYAIQLTFGDDDESIFAFRYIGKSWSVKNTAKRNLIFDNDLIAKIESTPCFQITPYIDFIQYKDDVFIADVKQFELAMNYHERLKEKKTEAITALCSSPSISPEFSSTLKTVIGNDKFLMRQLASVHDKGFYNNQNWLSNLRAAAATAGNWKIQFDTNNKIIINNDKNYIKEVLTLLQNKRVKTVVDGVVMDVDGELVAIG